MAPTDQKMKGRNGAEKHGDLKKEGINKKKRKWIPEHKLGSIKEGQGFAFKKKQKVKHEYNKLRRKERKKNQESNVLYKEEYPEHLKHLYLAEAEKLRSETWTNRVNRRKMRIKEQHKEMDGNQAVAAEEDHDNDVTVFTGGPETVSENPEPTTASEKQSLPLSNRMKKRMQKKTSYQKTKEEFEQIREKRKKKKEEYLKNKQQREEALQRYKQKKIETFRMLSKKTKKGQPNLNLQMEYLLKKIQGTDK